MSHKHPNTVDEKRQFQLERMILFSDAVFAIAITLLVIEIKVPEFEHAVTQHMLMGAMLEKLPDLIGFLISFAVIGQFWTNHHKLFGYVKDYNGGLLWLNLLMLLWIALMPFSTYLNMKYGNLDFTWFWYCSNLTLIGLSLYWLWKYIGKHPHLCTVAEDRLFLQFNYRRSLIVAMIFFSGGLLTLFPWDPIKWMARFVFLLIFPALSFLRKKYEQQQNKKAAAQ